MAGQALGPQGIDTAAFAQSTFLGDVYATIKKYLIQWQQNCPDAATMTALGYTSANNQTQVLQHVQNLVVLLQAMEGTQTAANTHSMINDWAKLQALS